MCLVSMVPCVPPIIMIAAACLFHLIIDTLVLIICTFIFYQPLHAEALLLLSMLDFIFSSLNFNIVVTRVKAPHEEVHLDPDARILPRSYSYRYIIGTPTSRPFVDVNSSRVSSI